MEVEDRRRWFGAGDLYYDLTVSDVVHSRTAAVLPQRFRYSVVAGEEKLIEDLEKFCNETKGILAFFAAATSFRRMK